ncbi:MAG: hypothetical protein EBV06_17185 [Planctomycetia bacterium]|nr:hypothetical protein [Planctomycetia bacterium]
MFVTFLDSVKPLVIIGTNLLVSGLVPNHRINGLLSLPFVVASKLSQVPFGLRSNCFERRLVGVVKFTLAGTLSLTSLRITT